MNCPELYISKTEISGITDSDFDASYTYKNSNVFEITLQIYSSNSLMS